MNLPPITIEDIPFPHKISLYSPDLLLDTIYVASENSVSTLTTPYDSPKIFPLTSDDTNPFHVMKKDYPYHGRVKI